MSDRKVITYRAKNPGRGRPRVAYDHTAPVAHMKNMQRVLKMLRLKKLRSADATYDRSAGTWTLSRRAGTEVVAVLTPSELVSMTVGELVDLVSK